jgi:hypothetical protein
VTRAVRLLVAYAAATLVMAWPLVNYAALASASYAGDTRLNIWILAWDNYAVLTGAPLFESNSFYPAPGSLVYNDHLFGLSLFTLPVHALTGNAVLAYNLVWLASFPLNGLAMHALLRRYTARDLAAFAGSLIYTFSFYKMLQGHGHLPQIWTWALPLSLLLVERWIDRPTIGRAAAWTAAVVLQSLATWYLAVMTIVANGILLAWRVAFSIRSGWWPRAWQLTLAAAAGGLAIWPFASPYRAMPPASRREAAFNAADLAAYLIPPQHTWVGRLWMTYVGDGPRWIWEERTLFLGWIAIGFAAIGLARLARGGRWRTAGVALAIAGAGFVLSLGPSSIVDGAPDWSPFALLARLPGVGGVRAPARFALLVLLGLAAIAALGVEALQARFGRRATLAVALLLPVMLSEWFVVGFPAGKPQPFPIPPIYRVEALKRARAIVSLPDHRATGPSFLNADYLYFSTAHWRPIVNGFGRTEPPEHFRVVSHMMAFPGPNNARTMRRLGVEYVVLHTARLDAGVAETMLRDAFASPEYELVTQIGPDYLFRVRP